MNVLINLSDEEYNWIKKSDKTIFADIASKECMLNAIKNGVALDNVTNREVINLLFQKDKSFNISTDKNGYLHIRGVKKEWLDKPYEGVQ